jgi:SAM-dependent methyltransferase
MTQPSSRSASQVSTEAVRWAYRLFLGREPLPGEAIERTAKFTSLDQLTYHFLWVDEEFRSGSRGKLITGADYQPDPTQRRGGRVWARILGGNRGVSRDATHWAYRLLLGREPESEWVIAEKLKAVDGIDLVRSFYRSKEFADRSLDLIEDFGGAHESALPLPPLRLRRAVGTIERSHWDNPDGSLVFGDEVPPESYRTVFDFGCGCGRTARQMLQQELPPKEYVGVDLNQDSIDWCCENLTPVAPAFTFHHLNAYNARFNPRGERRGLSFPTDEQFSLVNAHSVFTHIVEPSLRHYLAECARVLADGGSFRATWFLFDKTVYPMMQEGQNSLYINIEDPTNAVIYDYRFVESRYRDLGLVVTRIVPPTVRGFHWVLVAERLRAGLTSAQFPQDAADKGVVRPPQR